jgi:hypothetical protein
MLVTRLNKIGAGGSVVDPAVLEVLADALNRGFTPPVPLYGAIGTGDLTALASTGLCLIGERAWRTGTGPPPRFPLRPAEALGFMSSNAATIGEAALACHDLRGLTSAAVVIAALSLLAVRGSRSPTPRRCSGPGTAAAGGTGCGALLAAPGRAGTSGPVPGSRKLGTCPPDAGLLRLPGVPPGTARRSTHWRTRARS